MLKSASLSAKLASFTGSHAKVQFHISLFGRDRTITLGINLGSAKSSEDQFYNEAKKSAEGMKSEEEDLLLADESLLQTVMAEDPTNLLSEEVIPTPEEMAVAEVEVDELIARYMQEAQEEKASADVETSTTATDDAVAAETAAALTGASATAETAAALTDTSATAETAAAVESS
eukprot:JP446602.1.p1 GENE.JP446602.1~~JP446602.1.p1  ORF type:complete len:175 (+),score=65.48 JP446602.1:288-812(+)